MLKISFEGGTFQELLDQMQEVLHKQYPTTVPGKMETSAQAYQSEQIPRQPAVPTIPPPVNPTPTAPQDASFAAQGTDPATSAAAVNSQPAPQAAFNPGNQPPAAAPTYTLDQLAKAGATLAQSGKMEQALALLAKYGVQTISQLKPEQYGAFATELRALGAQV